MFRGMQYARAVHLFQRKHGPGTLPPNIDVLIDEHDLRKKYKDPITNEDFKVLLQGQSPAGTPGAGSPASGLPGRSSGRGPQPLSSTVTQTGQGQRSSGRASGPGRGAGAVGGVIGVQSKSTETSIRIYNGRTHYNEWAFVFQPTVQAPGSSTPGTIPGRGGPGQRGGPPSSPLGPGGRSVRPSPTRRPPGGRSPSGQQPQPLRRPGG